jgi:hypothetical protein
MGNILSSLIVASALFFAATGIGIWAAATTTDHATVHHFDLRMGSQSELLH